MEKIVMTSLGTGKLNLEGARRPLITPTSSPAKSCNKPWERALDAIDETRVESQSKRQAELHQVEERHRIAEAWANSGVGRRFINSRLDNYDTPTAAHDVAIRACWQAVGKLDKGDGILLIGEPESGKTHLLSGMLHAAIVNGLSARYITTEDFYVGLRGCMDKDGMTESAYLDGLAKPDVLALDDVYCVAAAKSAHEESYQYRMLWTLLDRRYREARATLASTNRSLDQIRDMLDSRTRRRLEAQVVMVPRRETK